MVASGEDPREPQVYTPHQAAEVLGVSASGLRRLASIYTKLYGELPRDPERSGPTAPRVWPAEAVGRLRKARQLVTTGRQQSIADALRVVDATEGEGELETMPTPSNDRPSGEVEQLLRAILETQQRTLAKMEALEAENRELRTQVAALPGPTEDRIAEKVRKWSASFWDYVRQLARGNS